MATADTARLIAILELKGDFSKKIGDAERQLGKLESRGTKAGRQIGIGLLRGATIAATGAAAFSGVFIKALGHASDLNETVSKTGVVFGASAAKVLAFGKTSAASLGLSENAALGAAATYGNLFVSMGLTEGKAADMSLKMVTLAADLASFNNASPEDTLLALRAGLVGETEPLRKFGINLNDAALRQEALALGLVDTTKKVLPPAIKAQAAYSLILKQSTTAQGDFKRTSGGLANQVRILKANFTDMAASLATPALPKIALIFQRINQLVKENQPQIAKLGDNIAGLFTDDNITAGFNAIKEGFQVAKDAAPAIADAAKITGAALKIAVDAFKSLPPELQKLAIAGLAVNKLTGGLVTNLAGGLISAVISSFKGMMNVNAAVVNVNGVAGGAGGVAGAAGKGGIGIGTVLASATILGIGYAVGQEVVNAMGGPLTTEERAANGRIVGKLGDIEIVMGRHPAQIAREMSRIKVPAGRGTLDRSNLPFTRKDRPTNAIGDPDTRQNRNDWKRSEGYLRNLGKLEAISVAVNATNAKLEANRLAFGAASVAQVSAAGRTTAAARASALAIERKRWQFTNNTIITNRISVRETANAVNSRSSVKIV